MFSPLAGGYYIADLWNELHWAWLIKFSSRSTFLVEYLKILIHTEKAYFILRW